MADSSSSFNQNTSPGVVYAPPDPPAWYQAPRVRVFAISFLLITAVGLAITFSRSPYYRSQAVLLTTAPTAVDRSVTEADVQHVAIQRQVLLGNEVLGAVEERLLQADGTAISAGDIRRHLSVQEIEGTHLVEVIAEGHDAPLLPRLINTAIDIYMDRRAEELERFAAETRARVGEELDELAAKLEQARTELEQFRATHDIISAEREENEVLARLTGLNSALGDARELEVTTRSRLEATREAMARGEVMVPQKDQPELTRLKTELRKLEDKLEKLEIRYTPEYLALDPELKVLPDQIVELETEVKNRESVGGQFVLSDAMHEYEAALRSVKNMEAQLAQHKRQVAEFTAIFTEHKSLVGDLEGLEEVYRETQARLVQLQARRIEKYPQVTVIDRAGVPDEAIGPDYLLHSMIVLAVALIGSVFTVWLVTYLGPRQPSELLLALAGLAARDTAPRPAVTGEGTATVEHKSAPVLPKQGNGGKADGGPAE